MPVILCPQCQGKLRMPENIEARRVKCPTCGNVFLSSEARLEGAPPPPAKSPSKPKSPPSKLSAALDSFEKVGGKKKKKEEVVEDFEIIDEVEQPKPKSKRHRDDEDTEEALPRSRDRRDDDRSRSRRPRDEEEEERPRSRRRRDEEDEEEERPRSRRGRDDDDDDRGRRRRGFDEDDSDDRRRGRRRDDVYDPPQRKTSSFGLVRVALLINAIASWVMGGALTCLVLALALGLMGIASSFPRALLDITAVGAISYVVVAGIAYGFCISGPNRNGMLGLAIASLAIMAVRLIVMIVVVSERSSSFGGPRGTILTGIPGFGTGLYALVRGLPVGSAFMMIFFLAATEIAQMIVFSLYLKAAAVTSRDHEGESNAGGFVTVWSVCAGVIAGCGILLGILIEVIKSSDFYQVALSIFTVCAVGGLAALYTWHGFISQNVMTGLDESGTRKRKRRRR